MPVLRRLSLFFLVVSAVLAVVPAAAQESGPGAVAVADVRGPLDQRGLDFLEDVVRHEDAQLIVLKIDNAGVASGDVTGLLNAIQISATPVVTWVGPDGAVAYGDVLDIIDFTTVIGAAPGARLGFSAPGSAEPDFFGELPYPLADQYADSSFEVLPPGADSVPASAPIAFVQPTIGQFIAALDGMVVATSNGDVTLETAQEITLEDGTVAIASSVDVRFLKPTLLTRFLRLGVRPDAAFFFLLAGLAAAAFEFYAAGAGIAAGVAVLSLFLAGYGFATLPMNWWAVAASILGIGMYTWDFQRHELGIRSIVGTILMLWGGVAFVGGSPQIGTSFWSVLLTIIGIMMFYLFAMTTIVRSRFGTPTIGREHLIGATGTAESALSPEGVVVIDGAKWRARAHRAANISPGAAVEVIAVEGITLQVAPPEIAKS